MRIFLKGVRNIFLVFLACIILFVSGAFVNNRIKLSQEKPLLENVPGQMVEVNGHKMHVYTEGEGEHTIVLMSGWSITSPSPYVNFLPLCKDLAKDNRVVIIERFGYGLSDVVGGKRTFDKVVEDDREALKQLGIEGPYVLCPHSIAGLESLIWAQNYPEEVEALIGMDMSDTSIKGNKEMGTPVLKFIAAIRATGLYRLLSSPEDDTVESRMVHAIQCKNMANKTVINEIKAIDESCDIINSKPLPTTPTLQFVAMQRLSEEEVQAWKASHQEIVDASSNGKMVELDCQHYVYRFEQERIVQEIGEYLKTLK